MLKNAIYGLVWLMVLCASVQAEIIGRELQYEVDGVKLTGFLAYDDAFGEGRRPAVLVVHEWWGHNDYARKRARDIARLGFVGFALDMYGDGKVARHPEDAKKFMTEVSSNMDVMQARFMAALNLVKSLDNVATDSIAAIGYCFGGGVVLNMARLGVDLDAVASFHGALSSDVKAQHGKVKARIIVFHGENDAFVSMDQLDAFEKEMQAAGADYQVVVYPGVEHSFTNPDADKYAEEFSLPLGYDADADEDSWVRMQEFLVDSFVN